MADTSSSGTSWIARLAGVALIWLAALVVMAFVALAVTAMLMPEGTTGDLDNSSRPAPTPSTADPDVSQDRELSGAARAPGEPTWDAAPLPPGTCTDVPVRPDDRLAEPVEVVECHEPHIAEVFAQLPALDSPEEHTAACLDAAALAGVPVGDPAPAVPFRVGAYVTVAGTLECTLSTPAVTGSVVMDGYESLTALE